MPHRAQYVVDVMTDDGRWITVTDTLICWLLDELRQVRNGTSDYYSEDELVATIRLRVRDLARRSGQQGDEVASDA